MKLYADIALIVTYREHIPEDAISIFEFPNQYEFNQLRAEEKKKKYSNIFQKETEAKIINNASLTVTPKVGIIAKIKEFLKKLFK